ncbi:hypothetical protein [Lysobacter solisilvae (ex Woo and Kim 2020)]|uniref:Uncharacterized protein n=1 Tax=Agrilutibacter terrestris TaxID=2865112 RepID=A0A7H0FWJ2_9GAMM|nr:hypothetical protein [Lysobacter terrestris]QNP40408.1 hypothetical protein H8B22_13150 [Lysobacter terrestris]
MTLRISRQALALAALIAPLTAFAQWSKTADANLVIGDGPLEQVQPKLAATADGGYYSVWFDNANGGYDVRLQRLDVKGRPQWGHNGRLVADRGLAYTTDYGIDVDADGNALLAFHDISQVDGKFHIIVSKVAPDGTPLWGNESGLVRLPDGGDYGALSPRIVATADGGAVVAWTVNYNINGQGRVVLQRLDANGALLWGEQNIQVPQVAGTSFIMADLHASEDGGFIVSWNAQLGRFINQFWTQKYDANGQPVWGATPVKLWDDNASGAIPNGSFARFVTDGNGGAVYCWDYTFGVSSRRVRVQHINADGGERFPHNGLPVSTDNVNNRGECSVSYDAGNDDTYVLWRERTPGSAFSQSGIYAQRFDGQGNRQWSDTGNVLLPLDPIAKSEVTMVPMGDGFVAAWALESYPLPMPIQATYITRDGNYGWSRGIVSIKTGPTGISKLSGTASRDGYAAFAWNSHSSFTDSDVAIQNIGRDGVLGKKESGAVK